MIRKGLAVVALFTATTLSAQFGQIQQQAAVAAGFTPADLTGIVFWWRTDTGNITSDVDGVNSHVDELSSADLVEMTGSKKPDVVSSYMNGLDGVQCDGIDDNLDVSFATFTDVSIGMIFAYDTHAAGDFIFDGSDNTDRHVFEQNGSAWAIWAGTFANGGTADDDDHYAVIKFDGSNSYLRLDGSEIIAGNTGTRALGGLTMCARNNEASAFAAVTYVEIVVVDNSGGIPSGELADLETYFADRSGV